MITATGMADDSLNEYMVPNEGPRNTENILDYIFSQCDVTGEGFAEASHLVTFLSELIKDSEVNQDTLNVLQTMLDPSNKNAVVDRSQFHKAMEEWEKLLKLSSAADNIEIIGNSPGFPGSNQCSDDFDKNWEASAATDDSKDQLRSSNNDLMLQKKWLEEQNADLLLLLKNSEESNTVLQSNCDSLLKRNDDLQAATKRIKSLTAENEELKELLLQSENKCSTLAMKLSKMELEAMNLQNSINDLESEKSTLKTKLDAWSDKEKEYLKVLDLQLEQILSLTEDVKLKDDKVMAQSEIIEELKDGMKALVASLKNHEEEKEALEEKLAEALQQNLSVTPTSTLQANWKLSPMYVAGLCSYEEVRDECKTLYKDLFSESPKFDADDISGLSIETELKGQEEKAEEIEVDLPEAKELKESFRNYMDYLKEIQGSSDAMVQVHHQGDVCEAEMTIKEAEEAEVDVESRVRAGDDAWMQFHADEGSDAPSCACSHEAGHPSPERLRRLQVVREVSALRSQILRSQAVLAALAQSSDLLGVPEAASAARGVSDYGDTFDVRSVGSNATQHGHHQPRSMESVAPTLPCGAGRASSSVLATTGEEAEGDDGGEGARRLLTKSCPALASQVSIATQVDVEDLLTPSPSRGEVSKETVASNTSPKRARSSSFLAAIEGAGSRVLEEVEVEHHPEPLQLEQISPRNDDNRTSAVGGPQPFKEPSDESASIGDGSDQSELAPSTSVFEPRVDPLDLDEYRSVRKLSVLPEEENEESVAGACELLSSPSASPHRHRRPRASPTPPPYRPPPNPYRPHSRSFESYLDPENCLRRREENGSRQGVPRQCSDPTPSPSTLRPSREVASDGSPRSPLRHSSTSRPLELFGGGPKAVRFDGSQDNMSSGEFRRKSSAFAHRRLFPPPPSTSPLAEEEETVRTPTSPNGDQGHFSRMEAEQEGREAVLEAMEEEDEASRGRPRIRARRRSTPGSPAAVIKRSAAVDYGEGVEEGDASSAASPAAVPFPSLTDPTLCKLGLLGGSSSEGAQRDALSEQDIEHKFTSLSLAFKTDRITLGSRLELQQRQRDLAEKNVLSEIKQLKTTLNVMFLLRDPTDFPKTEDVMAYLVSLIENRLCLNHLCTDMETTELLGKIRHQVDVLQQSTQRVSSHAEMYGAVQQESRVSTAIEIMLLHVENLKRLHEKDHGELEDTKRILLENNIILEGTPEPVEEGRQTQRSRYRSLQTLVGANKMGSRRRASIAAIPRIPGRMDPFITSNPLHMDVGGVGRVSAAESLITTTVTTITTTEPDNERRRESLASQLFGYGNCSPVEEKSGWSVTPPGEEDDDAQGGDDASEGGTSSWDGIGASTTEAEDILPATNQPTSSEDSFKSSRRSFGSGDVLVLRRDYVMTRAAEGRSSEHKRLSTPPAFNQTTPLFRISSLSGVFKEWMSKLPKIPWLSKRTGSSMAQDKNLTLLHARHCLTCILLVIAVISLGATFVSTDAQSDRWQQDYYHEFWKALQPHVTVRHYERHPV